MSNVETQLVLDVWDAVRDNVQVSKRAEVANRIMQALFDYGLESSDIASIVDEDDDLAEAFYFVYYDGEHPDDEDDYDEV